MYEKNYQTKALAQLDYELYVMELEDAVHCYDRRWVTCTRSWDDLPAVQQRDYEHELRDVNLDYFSF